MQLLINTPRKALKSDFLNSGATIEEIAAFKQNLGILLGKINEIEREENQKNCVRDFLNDTYYKATNEVNTKGTIDLVIHNGKGSDSSVAVIIEAKKPSNKSEFFSDSKANCKALQELVLYYMRERSEGNNDIKYLIATNIQAWYVIDAQDFERLFYENKKFKKDFEAFEAGQKVSDKTKHFYDVIAKEYIDTLETLPCTYFDLREYKDALENNSEKGDIKLVELYKLLSPQHLLKVPFANDSNKLNESFYRELLHIIGLEEVAEGSKSIIRRKKENRNAASLMELVIDELKTEGLHKLNNLKSFGDTLEEQTFSVALELCITWINRILFLKLLEGQLTSYHKDDEQVSPLGRFRGDNYRFLNTNMVHDFDELFKLFHKVLAVNTLERSERVKEKYKRVPYLNSSLFEISELEDRAIKINALDNSVVLDFYAKTILKTQKESHQKLTTLAYFFQFLDAYDFSGETQLIQSDKKALINASVLGKVFEKINGYKDGSIYTPAFITMYMCREAIRLAVVQKFNDTKQWNVRNFTELHNKISDIKEANAIINDLKICDPAVGSGHFLVSALNEILLIKHELGVLQDKDGKRIKNNEYDMEIINDELIVSEDHIPVSYNPKNKESQRLQETLFTEKQIIIENCLFGVDINPNSVKICRLRLWIELLKNAYYKSSLPFGEGRGGDLETLPNIDINIKCGNSLLSRFALDTDLSAALKSIKYDVKAYRGFVHEYKNMKDRDAKRGLQTIIDGIKGDFRTEIRSNDPKVKRAKKLKDDILFLPTQITIFGQTPAEKKIFDLKISDIRKEFEKINAEIEQIENNAIYTNAFEWRFEFPEVLDDEGKFLGFDAVIGNPPYIKEPENKNAFNGLRDKDCYQGKMDLWYLFGDLGLNIIKTNAHLCYIATNNWTTNAGASNFRDIMLKNSQFISLIDFGAHMIFDNASVQTMVMLFKKTNEIDNYTFDYRRLDGAKPKREDVLCLLDNTSTESTIFISPIMNKNTFIGKLLTFSSDENGSLLYKIKAKQNFILREKADKKLFIQSEIGTGIDVHQDFVNKASLQILDNDIKLGDGIFVLSEKEYKAYSFNAAEKSIIKPYYSSEQLSKYNGNAVNTHWLLYTKSDINKPDKITKKIPLDDYPTIKQHLDKFKAVITSDFAPYGLHRSREQHLFEGEKIIVLRKCPNEPIFTYTDFDCFVSQTFFVIQSNRIDLKYLTGLLNSKLVAFWLKNKGKMQGNNYQLDKEPLLEIPIYKPNHEEIAKISTLVNTILDKKATGADSSAEEKQIDTMVYALYELTAEEIEIIEKG